MILNNLRTALTNDPINIRVNDGKISQVSPMPINSELSLDFDNATVFPGLINSHDHLDFNLFPALGDRKYNNYTEWGKHIHQTYKEQIAKVLKVPESLREEWGIYKNLLCGVTTVVNHGKKIKMSDGLITVHQDSHTIHSVRFEKKWMLALNNPLKKNKFVNIHVGEGIDEAASQEIDQLIGWNLLKRNLVGIHGVAMDESQAKAFKALVWCPESNYFLLDKTAPIDRLKKNTTLLFGTDSTLTGSWSIWEHIRLARRTKSVTDKELFNALTINASNTWKLNSGEIVEGKDADLVIAKMKKNSFFDLDAEDILMVMHKGQINLFDEGLLPQLNTIGADDFSRVHINGTCKYVRGDLPVLMQKIKSYYPEANFPVI